jgi:methionine-rich copper-binding protein CopC
VLSTFAALLAVVPFLAGPRHAFGQANLMASSVADHATLDREPDFITLTFDARVLGDPASSILVQVDNRTVSVGAAALDDDTGTTLTIPLQLGTGDGQYVVSWVAAAMDDGALSTGVLSFVVNDPSPSSSDRLAQIAHGPQTSTLPGFAFTPMGADANGSGTVQLGSGGGFHQPAITLTGVTPNATFAVQLCSALAICTDPTDPSVQAQSSVRGTLVVTPLIAFTDNIVQVLVSNLSDPAEVYSAQVGPTDNRTPGFSDPPPQ